MLKAISPKSEEAGLKFFEAELTEYGSVLRLIFTTAQELDENNQFVSTIDGVDFVNQT